MNESNQNTPQTAETDQTTVEASKNNKFRKALTAAASVVALTGLVGGAALVEQSNDTASHAVSEKPAPANPEVTAPEKQVVVPGETLTELPQPVQVESTQDSNEQVQTPAETSDDNNVKESRMPSEPMVTEPSEPKMPSEPMVTEPTTPEVTPTDTPTEFVSDGGPTEGPTEFVSDGGPVEPKQ